MCLRCRRIACGYAKATSWHRFCHGLRQLIVINIDRSCVRIKRNRRRRTICCFRNHRQRAQKRFGGVCATSRRAIAWMQRSLIRNRSALWCARSSSAKSRGFEQIWGRLTQCIFSCNMRRWGSRIRTTPSHVKMCWQIKYQVWSAKLKHWQISSCVFASDLCWSRSYCRTHVQIGGSWNIVNVRGW